MATTITKTEKLVGKRIRRREDPRLITGTATYVDDIQMPGMHHAAILRSPHAAAKIRFDRHQQASARLPGVHAVFIGEDTKDAGAVPCGASLPGLRVPHHTSWRSIACISSATRSPSWSPPTATSRATAPI